jgi:hypothetical protein
MKKYIRGILWSVAVLFCSSAYAQNVWTQHNDQSRTGWYPYETTLNTTNVSPTTFGLKYSHIVDDKIYAQPLVVMKVNIPSVGAKNIVIVATVNNTVYAFDADENAPPYWQQNFTGKTAPSPATPCTNCRPAYFTDMHPSLCYPLYPDFDGNIGIVGTPVIDTMTNTMFFVSKMVNPNDTSLIDNRVYVPGQYFEYKYSPTGFHQYLHAIDITTGLDKPNSPVEIQAQGTGTGDGQSATGIIPFDPRRQFNRSGLVLNNGKIYIAFAAHCDFNASHGWVLSYDENTLNQVNHFITTPNDGRGGIWMSGAAPAVDISGNLYFTTGNSLNEDADIYPGEVHPYSTSPSDPANRGESVIKLAPDLTLSSYFTPFNYLALNDADKDFPIQVMLLPNTNLAMTGNKDDSIYILNQSNLGGFNPTSNTVKQTVNVSNGAYMHSSFAYFGGPTPYAYQYSESSSLTAYPVTANGLGPSIINASMPGPSGGSGGYMSVSSNGNDPATGVLWAYQAEHGCDANGGNCAGILHAVKANSINQEIWNSDMNSSQDAIGLFNKMSCPTIARGNVYLPANRNQLCIYGLMTGAGCANNVARFKFAESPSQANGFPITNVVDGDLSTIWTSGTNQDKDSVQIDLGATYDICKISINWVGTGYAKDFNIEASLDGNNWTIVDPVRGNSALYTEYDANITYRYIKMVGITRGGGTAYSISEFEVFGNTSGSCLPPAGLSASPGSGVTVFTTQTPTGTPGQDTQPVELGVQFTSNIAGYIIGVRFYETSGYYGTHIGELYKPDGTRLAQATFSNETGSGWQTVLFSTPVAIAANTTYIAAFYNSSAYYVADDNGFVNPITNANLTAYTGIYSYSTTPTLPTTTYQNSNYWVDPIFSLTATSDPSKEFLSWTSVTGATRYLINYRPDNSLTWISRTSTSNSLLISALSCGTQYDFEVQTDCGTSQSSETQSSFTTLNCPSNSCDIFPTRWFNVDIGDIGVAGSTCKMDTVYQLSGSGQIDGTADAFQFYYTNKGPTDLQFDGRVIQQDQVNAADKIGVMIRDSLTSTSRFAYVASVDNGASTMFEYRAVPGGPVTKVVGPSMSIPFFVMISKTGSSFGGYISPDGINWNPIGLPIDLNFGTGATTNVWNGFAATSSNNSVLSTGEIDSLKFTDNSEPLPITLLSFSAKEINQNHVLVSWATSMEHLVDHFEIERSVDDKSFVSIASVPAIGESTTPHYYSTTDNNPVQGINYYRLKELDKDNKFYYSPVTSVTFKGSENITVYPNPADDFTTINSSKEPIIYVNIYDVTGKLVRTIQPSENQNTVKLSLTDLSKGMYVLTIETKSTISRQKLIKQ